MRGDEYTPKIDTPSGDWEIEWNFVTGSCEYIRGMIKHTGTLYFLPDYRLEKEYKLKLKAANKAAAAAAESAESQGGGPSAVPYTGDSRKKRKTEKQDGTAAAAASAHTAIDADGMRVADLRAELKDRGLDVKGKKAALVQRLKEAIAAADGREAGDGDDAAAAETAKSSRPWEGALIAAIQNGQSRIKCGTIECLKWHSDVGGGVGEGLTYEKYADLYMPFGEELTEFGCFKDTLAAEHGFSGGDHGVGTLDTGTLADSYLSEMGMGSTLYIEKVRVAEPFRGLGLGLFMVDHACNFINCHMSTTALTPGSLLRGEEQFLQFPDPLEIAFDDAYPGAYWDAYPHLKPYSFGHFDPEKPIPPHVAAEHKRRNQHFIDVRLKLAEYYDLIGLSLMKHKLPDGKENLFCARWNGYVMPSIRAVLPHLFSE